jgi:hypothetical protein
VETNVLLRDLPLRDYVEYSLLAFPSSLPSLSLGPVVCVSVWEGRLSMPRPAPSEALSQLRLTTEEHVPLEDCAKGAVAILVALANDCDLTDLATFSSHDPDNQTTQAY